MPTTRNAEYGHPAKRRVADGLDDRRNAALGLAAGQLQGETASDAEGGERDDERMRQAAPHVDAAVDEADGRAGSEHHEDDDEARVAVRIHDGPDHRGERQRRADRQVDAAGEDDEQLADREHRDGRSLGQHVAGVARREEHRRQQRHRNDQTGQDQDGAEADDAEGDAKQPEVALLLVVDRAGNSSGAGDATSTARGLRAWVATRRGRPVPPTLAKLVIVSSPPVRFPMRRRDGDVEL